MGRWREPIETFSYDMDRAERTEVVAQFRSTGSSQRNKETDNPWSGRHEPSPSPSPKSRHAFDKGGDDSSPNELTKDRGSLRDERVLHERNDKQEKPEKLERPKKTWKEDKPKISESKVER